MSGLGALFSGPAKPQVQPVVRMPDREDPEALQAKARQQRALTAGAGRQSTNLTGNGGAYSGTVLGN
jgi:hypothetical protein